jgi:DNA polymerase elongation subunit (family B)
MLYKLTLENILFLDIETVPQEEHFKNVSPEMQELYAQKTAYQRGDTFSPEEFYHKAGIWAEFGKIICISVGHFSFKGPKKFRVRSFYGEEQDILAQFNQLLDAHFSQARHVLCAHNGKEFDFPYLARRMVILGIKIPFKLQLFGKKPWEVPHLDTMDLWKFGDYKHYTSLKLLTQVLGIPSPKDDISGEQVRDVYYKQKGMDRIIRYCEKDTIAVAQLMLRYRNEDILQESEIVIT